MGGGKKRAVLAIALLNLFYGPGILSPKKCAFFSRPGNHFRKPQPQRGPAAKSSPALTWPSAGGRGKVGCGMPEGRILPGARRGSAHRRAELKQL